MRKKEYSPPIYVGQNLYIKPTYIVSMPEFSYDTKYSSNSFLENQDNLKDNNHHGQLSKKAQTGIKNAINWLLVAAKPKRIYSKNHKKTFSFKVSFITLTLPDTLEPVTNKDFQTKLLNPFLVYCRKYLGLKNYVWKLELQKNGKIHAHLTTDCFIYWRDLRKHWNRLLFRNGYISEFARSFGHYNPNSTDVHSVQKVRNLGAYLAKYLSKNTEGQTTIKGRIWGCSYELSAANKTHLHVPSSECSETLTCLMQKEIKWKDLIQQKNEFCEPRKIGEVYLLNFKNWQQDIKGEIKSKFLAVRNSITSLVQYFDNQEFSSV